MSLAALSDVQSGKEEALSPLLFLCGLYFISSLFLENDNIWRISGRRVLLMRPFEKWVSCEWALLLSGRPWRGSANRHGFCLISVGSAFLQLPHFSAWSLFRVIHPSLVQLGSIGNKKTYKSLICRFCGKRGIRTPGTAVPYSGFRVRPVRPLRHLSWSDYGHKGSKKLIGWWILRKKNSKKKEGLLVTEEPFFTIMELIPWKLLKVTIV